MMRDTDIVRHRDWLSSSLASLGVSVSGDALDDALRYLDCVLDSPTANVTAIRDPEEAVRLHLLDSFVALPALARSEPGVLVDLGTGGGFPGVPLALASGRAAVLLDSVSRKVELVRECLNATLPDSGIEAVCSRSEDHAAAVGPAYGVAVARAVAEMPALLEMCRPLVRDGGSVVLLKANCDENELCRSESAAAILGLSLDSVDEYVLPEGNERRSIYRYTVTRPSEVELPRRPGRATKKPLA